MQTQEIVLPDHYAPALINDDWDGLTDDEYLDLRDKLREKGLRTARCLTYEDNVGFRKYHAMSEWGWGAAYCYTFIFVTS